MIKNYALTFILVFYSTTFFAKNNIAFIENKGQIIDQNNNLNPTVKYLWTGNGIKVQLKKNSFSYEVLNYKKQLRKRALPQSLLKNIKYWQFLDSSVLYSHRIDIELIGANPHPELKPEGQSEDYLNYYTTGTPETGVTYVRHYNKITYQNIYPNIDLEFVLDAANKQPFKYNFIVRLGGKVNDIQLKYNGANSTELTQSGSLNIATAYGNFEESIPKSFVAETGKDITVHYQQNREGIYGFSAGNYDGQQTLVIDPWCTYFGWDGSQSVNLQVGVADITIGSDKSSYTTGSVDILSNIATSGAFQTTYGGGNVDAFIRKFNANGFPVWCTYFGGNSDDRGRSISCDEFNNIYVTGSTWSPNNIATSGSFLSTLPLTTWTSFLTKFNSNGIRQWGTYYPANSYKLKLDHSSNILIGGYAEDTSAVTLGAHQTTPGGNGDDFLAKFTSSGSRIWGTFYGGSGFENTTIGLAIDGQDNIFLSGTTESPNNISTSGSFQPNYGGGSDNFLVKFNTSGVRQWGTYYGGSGNEEHYTYIASDASGNIYFSGQACSPNVFATSSAYQLTLMGMEDYFLAKFNINGQRIWSTYFGGLEDDYVFALNTDGNNNVVFSGSTLSSTNIATSGSLQPNFTVGASGWSDAFIEKFSTSGSRIWGTYFGGNGNESWTISTIDNNNNVIITGNTTSKGIATIGAYQTTLIDTVNGDIFLASLDSNGKFTTGIGEVNAITSLIKVYPNPAKDKITVSIKDYAGKGGSLVLMDIEGKAVKSVITLRQAQGDKDIVIDVKDLSAGVYLLQYEDGEVCETVKVVKE